MNCGFAQPGRPSIGSWVTYGLGSETTDLPAFIVMSTGAGISGGSANWSSGFMPSLYTGTRFRNAGTPILNVDSPAGADMRLANETLNLVNSINRRRLAADGDPEIATRIASYEMAHRLQTSAPELMNLSDESPETLALYGCKPEESSFSRACLIARRLVERGVRFVQLFLGGQPWDNHTNIREGLPAICRRTDKPAAALVTDLKSRGLLDTTLVHWGGEIGRLPVTEGEGSACGRDHNGQGFSIWMAGGGVKPGMAFGETDEVGHRAVTDIVTPNDWQATVLRLFGLDHERLVYRHDGVEQRLTAGRPARIVDGILA
jgi:hypothetical protein